MYHLKDDIRAERSAQMLYDALMEVIKTKPFRKVTVSDLSQVSTVSRATFYRNFDEIVDILYWQCDRLFHEVLTDFTESDPDLSQEDVLLEYVLSFWMEPGRMKLLEILMDSGRIDIIYNGFVNNAPILMDFLKEKNVPMSTDNYEYFISVRAGFFVGIIRAWIMTGKKQTPEELSGIIRRQHDDVVKSGLLI
ncbi:MAG: TetR/AcrR family transcriptional regulator [Anaerovoracaceae bacterium]